MLLTKFQEFHTQFKSLKEIEDHLKNYDLKSNLPVESIDKIDEFINLSKNILDRLTEEIYKNSEMSLRFLAMKLVILFGKLKVEILFCKIMKITLDELIDVDDRQQFEQMLPYQYIKQLNKLQYLIAIKCPDNQLLDGIKITDEINRIIDGIKRKTIIPQLQTNLDDLTDQDLFSDQLITIENDQKQYDDVRKLEKLIVNNLETLAITYRKQMQLELFVKTKHLILEKLFYENLTTIFVWIKKISQMSLYFIDNQQFHRARHYLTFSWYQLKLFSKYAREKHGDCDSDSDDVNRQKMLEYCDYLFGELASIWMLYAMQLFTVSKEKYITNFNAICKSSKTLMTNGNLTKIKQILHDKLYYQSSSKLMDRMDEEEKPKEFTYGMIKDEIDLELSVIDEEFLTEINGNNLYRNYQMCSELTGNQCDNDDDNDDDDDDGENSADVDQNKECRTNRYPIEHHELRFSIKIVDKMEKDVVANFIENSEMAYDMFRHVSYMIKCIPKFMNPVIRPYEYVCFVIDVSEIYGHLVFFEESIENKYLLQLNQSDTIENMIGLLKEKCPEFYTFISSILLKQLLDIQINLIKLNYKRILEAEMKTSTNKHDEHELERKIDDFENGMQKVNALQQFNHNCTTFGLFVPSTS